LRQRVSGRLIAVQSPLQPCREAPIGEACRTLFRELKNPYYIGDEVGLTQTTGWVDAWTLEGIVSLSGRGMLVVSVAPQLG